MDSGSAPLRRVAAEKRNARATPFGVMPALVAGIHGVRSMKEDVDARPKAGHDAERMAKPYRP